MIFVCVFLGSLFALSSIMLYFSVRKNLEFLEQQETLLLSIEQSLHNLNVCRKRIDKKAKLELFLDDRIVKELVDDMKEVRNIVTLIVENLAGEKHALEIIQNINDTA